MTPLSYEIFYANADVILYRILSHIQLTPPYEVEGYIRRTSRGTRVLLVLLRYIKVPFGFCMRTVLTTSAYPSRIKLYKIQNTKNVAG